VLDGNTFRAYPVRVGISNGMMTEVVGGLKPGQKIITEFKMHGEEVLGNNGNNNPFMPRPRNRQQQQQKK
jgi:HlyD family secretion protein